MTPFLNDAHWKTSQSVCVCVLLARLSRTREVYCIFCIVLCVDVHVARQLKIDGFVFIFDLTGELLKSGRAYIDSFVNIINIYYKRNSCTHFLDKYFSQ